MKVINKTKWNTRDLKNICKKVIDKMGARKDTKIYIEISRARWSKYHGYAYYNSNTIVMKIPTITTIEHKTIYHPTEKTIGSDGKEYPKVIRFDKISHPTEFNVVDFTQILEHEIGHNQGLHHKEMDNLGKHNVDYIKDLKVNQKEMKLKPKVDIVELRYKRALQNLKTNITKLKRAETLVKKWKIKVKYYENNRKKKF